MITAHYLKQRQEIHLFLHQAFMEKHRNSRVWSFSKSFWMYWNDAHFPSAMSQQLIKSTILLLTRCDKEWAGM